MGRGTNNSVRLRKEVAGWYTVSSICRGMPSKVSLLRLMDFIQNDVTSTRDGQIIWD